MFASTELARRIEAAERGLIEECTSAVARRTGGGETFLRALAGGVAAFSGTDSPLTKVAGLGFGGPPALADLERVEAEFDARGTAVQVELCSLAEGGVAELLTRRGYALVGFENVLGRTLDERTLAPERPGLAIAPSRADEFEAWLAAVVEAFAAPDGQGVEDHESHPREALARAVRDMSGASGLVHYVARREGVLAGGASLRLADGVAQLCGAGTLPAHRRRGVQAALLERRLADAARAGCELAIVTTLPGSKSQENVQRQGFELLYTRAILRRPAS